MEHQQQREAIAVQASERVWGLIWGIGTYATGAEGRAKIKAIILQALAAAPEDNPQDEIETYECLCGGSITSSGGRWHCGGCLFSGASACPVPPEREDC